MPGNYTARLTVDGKVYNQSIIVKMDPRVKTSVKDLTLQHDLSLICYKNILKCQDDLKKISDKDKVAETRKYLNSFSSLQNTLQDGDWPPTTQVIKAVKETVAAYEGMKK
jgi:hypothetical protein